MTLPLTRVDIGHCENLMVISDVHLRDPDDSLSALFFKTLGELKNPGTLVFLGDIFDFIYADSVYFLNRWHRFFSLSESLRQRGFKVIFVEGNHDFGFHEVDKKLSRYFDASGDIEVVLHHSLLGKTILRHGDDVICKPGYEKFRRFIKSKPLQMVLSNVPHRLVDWACLQWAHRSRGRHDTYEVGRPLIDSCLKNFIKFDEMFYRDVKTVVFGHIHVDADFILQSGPRFVSGPDWVMCPSVLTVDSRPLQREYLVATPQNNASVFVIRDDQQS